MSNINALLRAFPPHNGWMRPPSVLSVLLRCIRMAEHHAYHGCHDHTSTLRTPEGMKLMNVAGVDHDHDEAILEHVSSQTTVSGGAELSMPRPMIPFDSTMSVCPVLSPLRANAVLCAHATIETEPMASPRMHGCEQ